MRFAARPGLDVHHLRAALPLGSQVEELTPGAYVVRGAVDPALIATLTAWCAAQGVLAQSLSVEHRTLEDVFLDLTGRSA
jgi:ABC-2 type transport system ATP-binding protein